MREVDARSFLPLLLWVSFFVVSHVAARVRERFAAAFEYVWSTLHVHVKIVWSSLQIGAAASAASDALVPATPWRCAISCGSSASRRSGIWGSPAPRGRSGLRASTALRDDLAGNRRASAVASYAWHRGGKSTEERARARDRTPFGCCCATRPRARRRRSSRPSAATTTSARAKLPRGRLRHRVRARPTARWWCTSMRVHLPCRHQRRYYAAARCTRARSNGHERRT